MPQPLTSDLSRLLVIWEISAHHSTLANVNLGLNTENCILNKIFCMQMASQEPLGKVLYLPESDFTVGIKIGLQYNVSRPEKE